jgi:hypothetical protein
MVVVVLPAPALTAVIVIVNEPRLAAEPAVMVATEAVDEPVSDVGDMAKATPAGMPEALRVTAPVNPPVRVSVMVTWSLEPRTRLIAARLAVRPMEYALTGSSLQPATTMRRTAVRRNPWIVMPTCAPCESVLRGSKRMRDA